MANHVLFCYDSRHPKQNPHSVLKGSSARLSNQMAYFSTVSVSDLTRWKEQKRRIFSSKPYVSRPAYSCRKEDASLGQDEGRQTRTDDKMAEGGVGDPLHSKMESEELGIFQEPQCLISTDEAGHLKVDMSILDQLKTLDKRLVVVAIAGLYRTGKSYLMNRLAGKSAGFALGSTIQSKTKGIWIWVRPHPVEVGAYLVLMDTEGLGDAEKGDARHDESIITLATLLSSTLVFNYLGAIDEDMITKLNFVTTIAKILQTQSPHRISHVTLPQLLIALRDFYLELEIEGKKVTANRYLEHLLKPRQDRTDEYNNLRKRIRDNFPKRRCYTFDRPTTARAKLKKLETLSNEELSEDFLNDSHKFTQFVYDRCPPMTMPDGADITGSMYASLVTSYVDAIRQGNLPNIGNAFNAVIREQNRKAIERAEQVFRDEMKRSVKFPVGLFQLDCALANASMSATEEFMMKRFEERHDHSVNEFDGKINSLMEEYASLNDEVSLTKSRNMLKSLDHNIQRNMERGRYGGIGGPAIYQRDIENVKVAYRKCENLGVKMESALEKYCETASEYEKFLKVSEATLKEEIRRREAAEAKVREEARKADEEVRRKERMMKELEEREREQELYRKSVELQHQLQMEEMQLVFEQDTDAIAEAQREELTNEHIGDMELLQLQSVLWEIRRTHPDEQLEFYDHENLNQ